MPYVLPQVLVFQEFNTFPNEITEPLRACAIGPLAKLHRYTAADEQDGIRLGAYDALIDKDYSWPGRSAGGLVDQAYTRVFMDDAYLQYFHDSLGNAEEITPVDGYNNRIKAESLSFRENNGVDRSAAFLDRDVRAGDAVYIRGVIGGDDVTLWTYVKGFVAEVVAAVVGEAYPDQNNVATQSSSASAEQIAGATNCLTLIASTTYYDGLIDGGVNDTYQVLVTQGSTGGDLTTARLRIFSATGDDDVLEVAPAAEGDGKTVTTRGLNLKFIIGGDGSSCSSGSPETANDLIAGQKFRVVIAQQFEAAIARSGGGYTGDIDTTYIVRVSRGGLFAASDPSERPQITVSTAHGSDFSGPLTITADNTAFPIGSKGTTIRYGGTQGFSSSSSGNSESELDSLSGLRKGDVFYVPVTAASSGRIGTLILGHNMNDDLLTASDLELKLFIRKDIEVSRQRVEAAPQLNFTTSATQITIAAGITAYDTSWTDGGVEQPLDVVRGTLFVHYREWLTASAGFGSVADETDVAALPGPLDPDNPLKWALSKGVANANGTDYKYVAIGDPDDTDVWLAGLDLIAGRDDVYNLVPLTRNRTVLDAYAGHVAAQSSAENGRWRAMFVSLSAETTKAVVDATLSANEQAVLATLADDPDTSGTQYTLLEITSGNADLIDMGVQTGDIVRFLYTVDGFGTESYSEFVVDAVINETELRLVTGHTASIGVAQKVEIWHNNSKTEIAEQLGLAAGTYGSRRVCAVWPDIVGAGGESMEGYHLCAALAGLASGVVPHQGLTNVQIAGFDDLSRTTDFFSVAQLKTMAAKGVWVVTQDRDGNIVTQHALTTDMTDTNTQEEMRRRNADSISYFFLHRLAQYIGRSNVTPSMLAVLRIQLVSAIEFLKSNGFSETLGAQLIDGDVVELRQHTLLKDRVVATLSLTAPFPLNNLELHLVF